MRILTLPLYLKDIEQKLFFLVVLFLPSQLGKHFWPEFASIFSIRTDYFSPTIYFWDLLFLLLLSVFFIQKKRFKSYPLFLLLLFCFTQALSLAVAENIGAGVVRLWNYFYVGLFGVYIASSKLSNIKTTLYLGLLIGILYTGIVGILQVLLGKTLGLWLLGERNFSLSTFSIATFDWYGQVFLRAYATFPHPNVFAAYLISALTLILFLHSNEVRRKSEVVLMAFVAGSLALFLTFSRVALGLYSFLFIYILRNQLKLLLIILLFLLPFLYVRYISAFNFDHLSFLRREELAVQSFEMFSNSPLLGVGLNNFIYVLAYGDIVSGEHRFLQPVHNIFLLTLSETGVIGFLGLLLFLYPVIKNLFSHYFEFRSNVRFLLYLWFCFLVMGLFDHYFLTLPQGQRLFFLVWGISMLEYGSAGTDKQV